MVYLFNGISTPYGLFNAKIDYNRGEREANKRERNREREREREKIKEVKREKGLGWFICLMAYQIFMVYLKLELDYNRGDWETGRGIEVNKRKEKEKREKMVGCLGFMEYQP